MLSYGQYARNGDTCKGEDGVTAFCGIRSYLSTMRKRRHTMLAAMVAVFVGKPLPIAWGT
jgi:hypothetical protein